MMPKSILMALGLVLLAFVLVGGVYAQDLQQTQGIGYAYVSHSSDGVNVTFSNLKTGTVVSSDILIDGGQFIPTYVGPSVMSTSWGSGPNQTQSDVFITHTMFTNATLKGKIVEQSSHSYSFQLTLPNNEQIVSFPDGSYRVVNSLSDTMDGITIPAPWGMDANGSYVPMSYSQQFLNPTQLNLNINNVTPIVYPLTIDPTWVATSGFWTLVSGTTTSIMCNTTGTVTYTMPSGLINNTISNIVLIGSGGNGGTGSNLNGGAAGSIGSETTQASYTATGGTQYTLTVPAPGSGSSTTALGYSAAGGSNGATGGGGATGANGINGITNVYLPIATSGAGGYGSIWVPAQGCEAQSAPGAGATGFGASGGGGGSGAYESTQGCGYGGPGGYGAPGLITFNYTNTGTSSVPTPTTQFLLSATGGSAPVVIQFTDKTVNASSWAWSDNAYVNGVLSSSGNMFSTSQNPAQSFGTAGVNTEYYIYETAENVTSGAFNTSIQNAWVNTTGIIPSFISNETVPNVPLSILFTDTSSPTPASWGWNFGDSSATNYYNSQLVLDMLGNLTPFVDSSPSPNTVTMHGNATIGAGPGGMNSNGAAMWFDGITGDYASVPTTNTNFGTSSYTISVLVNPQSLYSNIIDSANLSLTIQNNVLNFTTSNASATTILSGGTVPQGQWSSIQIDKNSTYLTSYINGVVAQQQVISAAYSVLPTGTMKVGQ